MKMAKVLVAMVMVLGATVVRADEPIKQPVVEKKGVTLTKESIGPMLEGMGYTVKEGKYSNGHPYFDIVQDHAGLSIPVRVAVSPNGRNVWLHVNVADLPPQDQIPVEVLLNLFRQNANTTGKAQFAVRGNNLMLMQPFENREVTPVLVRTELQDLCQITKNLEKDYNPKNWKPTEKTAVKTVEMK
jgi:hypothetical protein